ncbi:MAG: division/cell wall cluster transcriptional repressor MraZ [Firmicutes bacterium]|nr:division/cell wall cluster transcriptional repressor MraZ [Bacillota bacterium]
MTQNERFYGEYAHAIDDKGRIIIPAKLRNLLGDEFYITKGFDNCLAVYPKERWEEFMTKLSALPKSVKRNRQLSRHFTASACKCEPDKNGRIIISQSLKEFAALSKEIVSIGSNDCIEIWDKKAWEEYNAEYDNSAVDLDFEIDF